MAMLEFKEIYGFLDLSESWGFGLPRSPCGSLAMTDKKTHFVILQ